MLNFGLIVLVLGQDVHCPRDHQRHGRERHVRQRQHDQQRTRTLALPPPWTRFKIKRAAEYTLAKLARPTRIRLTGHTHGCLVEIRRGFATMSRATGVHRLWVAATQACKRPRRAEAALPAVDHVPDMTGHAVLDLVEMRAEAVMQYPLQRLDKLIGLDLGRRSSARLGRRGDLLGGDRLLVAYTALSASPRHRT